MKSNSPFQLVEKQGIPMFSIPYFNTTGKVKAYFSTRLGGVSNGECGTMNLNLFKPKDVDNSKKNMELFCNAIHFDLSRIVTNREKHTDKVRIVSSRDIKPDLYDESSYLHADGLITQSKDIFLYGFVSDCALCYFWDPEHEVIALTHAGWKGSLNGVLVKTVNMMKAHFDTNPSKLIAAFGPSIGPCCFEVDYPVANLFENANSNFHPFIKEPVTDDNKYHIDLWRINEIILLETGLKKENILSADICTKCNENLLHSYRRSHGENGVLGAFFRLL